MQSLVASHRRQLGALAEVTNRFQFQKKTLEKTNDGGDIMEFGSYHRQSYLTRQSSNSLVNYHGVMEHCKTNDIEYTFKPIPENDRVTINVSGLTFETYRETLLQFPDTLLGSPERIEKFYEEDKKQYFLPRNRLAFDGILYFYQSGGHVYRPPNVSVMEFFEEMRFFDLGDDILESYIHRENVCVDCVADTPELVKRKDAHKKENRKPTWHMCIAFFSIISIVICTILLLLETIPSLSYEYGEAAFLPFNILFAVFFTLEFFIRFCFSKSKRMFGFSFLTLFDVLSIPPFYIVVILSYSSGLTDSWYIRFIKFLRILKLFQLGRHIEGLRIYAKTFCTSFNDILMMIFLLAVGMILFSSGVYYTQASGAYFFQSIPDAFWYSIITMTTVGYGDIVPKTELGKLIGASCALTGLLVLALMVPIIAANFEKHYQEVKYEKQHLPCRIRRENPRKTRRNQRIEIDNVSTLNGDVETNNINNIVTNPKPLLGNGVDNKAFIGSVDIGLNFDTGADSYTKHDGTTCKSTYNQVKPIIIDAEVVPWFGDKVDGDESDLELLECTSPKSDIDRMDLDCDGMSDIYKKIESENTQL